MTASIRATGVIADSGQRYVWLNQLDTSALIPPKVFVLSNKALVSTLAEHQIMVTDKKELEALVASVQHLDYSPIKGICETTGWTGNRFAMQDGTVIATEPEAPPCVAFPTASGRPSTAGTHKAWKVGAARPLAEQPLPAFVLMLPFLAPLLHLMPMVPNFTIGLTGRVGCGKSTLLKIAASASGGIGVGGGNRYWHCLEEVGGGMAELLDVHRDQLMIFDNGEALFTKANAKAAAKIYKALAHDLPSAKVRSVALIATRDSLRDAGGFGVQGSDHLIPLWVSDAAPHGVFESPPKDFPSGAAFAEALTLQAAANHGHAIRRFVEKVAASKSTNLDRLQRRIDAWQREFLEQAAVDGNDGMDQRVARIFAAVFAAGSEARHRGILPKALNCLDVALRCYRAHYIPDEAEQPFATRLKTLIQRSDIVTISKGANKEVQAEASSKALGTVVHLSTRRELRIPKSKIYMAFSDWDQLKNRDDVRSVLKVDGRNLASKTTLAPGLKKDRLFCFRLEFEDESIFDNADVESEVAAETDEYVDW